MSKLNDKFIFILRVFNQIDQYNSFAGGEIHTLHFDWWEHTLNHQR
jgi:hypothetical protein